MRKKALPLYVAAAGLGAALVLAAPSAFAACAGGAPNGIDDAGEQCDFGDVANDCCTDSCTLAAVNSPCDDYDVCSIDTKCDSAGQCVGVPDPFHPQGSLCDDHNDCTQNTKCNSNGQCAGGSGKNNDPCRERWDDGSYKNCYVRTCSYKVCSKAVTTDLCEIDGDACTASNCVDPDGATPATMCGAEPPLAVGQPCNSDGSTCTIEKCRDLDSNPATPLTCELENTVTCTDTNLTDCKYKDCDPVTGECTVTVKFPAGMPCLDDGNVCTDDFCGSKGNCRHPGVVDPLPCSDGQECTGPDVCDGNSCDSGPNAPNNTPCSDDGNLCTLDYCAIGVCSHTGTNSSNGQTTNGIVCPDDGATCSVDYCSTAVCAHGAINIFTGENRDGLVCTDTNPCTSASACSGGACAGTACTGSGSCGAYCGAPACSTTLTACGCG